MRTRPTAVRIAPRQIHGRLWSMKLDSGQWMRPAPCPIPSNPINTTAMPKRSANLTSARGMNEQTALRNGGERGQFGAV